MRHFLFLCLFILNLSVAAPQQALFPLHRIPYKTIKPFLSQLEITTLFSYNQLPYVLGVENNQLIASAGDNIYVYGFKTVPQQHYYNIYRLDQPFVDPEDKSHKVLGHAALHIASAVLIHYGEPSTFKILHAEREVLRGDRLFPEFRPPIDNGYLITHLPRDGVHGKILAVEGGVNKIGRFQVVIINQGQTQGMQVGDLFPILRPSKPLPLLHVKPSDKVKSVTPAPLQIGELIVFRTFPKLSLGLIWNATAAISRLDWVGDA